MKTMRARIAATLPPSGLVLAVAATLGGCADLRRAVSLPPVNLESPVASAVERGTFARLPAPSFLDVPPAPKNLPTPVEVKTSVVAMVRCRRALVAWAPAHPPMVSNLTAFAATERAQVDTNPADVPTAADAAQMQSEAAQLRAYAAPPPAIASGPPPSAAAATPPPEVVAPPVVAAPPPRGVAAPHAAVKVARAPAHRASRTPHPVQSAPAASQASVAAVAPPTVSPAHHAPHAATASRPTVDSLASTASSPTVAAGSSTPVDIEPGFIAIAPALPAPLGDPLLNHCR